MKAADPTPELAKKAFKNAQKRATEAAGIQSSKRGGRGPLPAIELFQRENNLLSHLVRSRLTHLGLDFVSHTVPRSSAQKQEQLVRAGGKNQIPFLIDRSSGTKLYGYRAILAYLDRAYGRPSSSLGDLGALGALGEARLRELARLAQSTLNRMREATQQIRSRATAT